MIGKARTPSQILIYPNPTVTAPQMQITAAALRPFFLIDR